MSDTCYCGHVQDEHEPAGFFRPCEIDGCDCDDFDLDPEASL